MDRHREAVAVIAATIRQFYDRKEPFRIFHGSTNSTRPLSLQRNGMVDTSSLKHVLSVDREKKTVLVEPNVPMDELVKATLEHDLVPPVVMEFPGITVGGGFAGTSGESSSFKYGFFDKTVNWIEIVLANGEVATASPNENADLFQGAAGSFGTLGVTTLLELRLIAAKKYIELTYLPVPNTAEAIRKMKKISQYPDLDYLDAIMFSPTSGVVMGGKLTNTPRPSFALQTFHRPRDPWFSLHAQTQPNTTEVIPLTSYLFRYDRGAFWTGVHAFRYFKVPFNPLTRWCLDYFMHTRVMYHALHESGHMDRYVLQDLVLPHGHAEAFVRHVDAELGIYPLWLCPVRKMGAGERSFHPHAGEDEMPVNIGVWGPGPTDRERFVEVNRRLEMKLRELGGMKWLYAQVFYAEEEFWALYDRSGYEALRRKYHATSLLSVYEKVKRTVRKTSGIKRVVFSIWPLSGLYGVWRSFIGGDYLIARERSGILFWSLLIASLVGIFAVLAQQMKG
jgi:Delta24-sterol reductase